jgi:hypothetical protein
MWPENVEILPFGLSVYAFFPENIDYTAEKWFAVCSGGAPIEIEMQYETNIYEVEMNIKLYDMSYNEIDKKSYICAKKDRAVEINANVGTGWYLVKAYYNVSNSAELLELEPYYHNDFHLYSRPGPRVLQLNENYAVNAATAKSYVFQAPMEAEYEVITSGAAKTGTIIDSIPDGLTEVDDEDENDGLYMRTLMLPNRKQYIKVEETGGYTVQIRRYEPEGNVTLRLEDEGLDVTGEYAKMGIYLDDTDVSETVGLVRLKIKYNGEGLSFAGFTPAPMPPNTRISVSGNGDLGVGMYYDYESQTMTALTGQKICDYYFSANETPVSDVRVTFKEALIAEENSAAYPNLEECALSFEDMSGNSDGIFQTSSISNEPEILEAGKEYISDEYGIWSEYEEEPEEVESQWGGGLIQPLAMMYPVAFTGDIEFHEMQEGTITEDWLNFPTYIYDVNADGTFSTSDLAAYYNYNKGNIRLSLEQAVICAPTQYKKGKMPFLRYTVFTEMINTMQNLQNDGANGLLHSILWSYPALQVIRPSNSFAWNNDGVWAKAQKIGTSYNANRQPVGTATLTVKAEAYYPKLYYWLTKAGEMTNGGDNTVVYSGVISANGTVTIPKLQGMYILKVSPDTNNATECASGTYSVKLTQDSVSAGSFSVPSVSYNGGGGAKLGIGNSVGFNLTGSNVTAGSYTVKLLMSWDNGSFTEKASRTLSLSGAVSQAVSFSGIGITGTTGGVNLKTRVEVSRNGSFVYGKDLNTPITGMMPVPIVFTDSAAGTFIGCNNPEGLAQLSHLSDSGAGSQLLMRVPGLTNKGVTGELNGSNKYTFSAFHNTTLIGNGADNYPTYDLLFRTAGNSEIRINALGVQWHEAGGSDWSSMQAWADYKGRQIFPLDGADTTNPPTPRTYTINLNNNNNNVWLSDIYNDTSVDGKTWSKPTTNMQPIFLIMDFQVISGNVDLEWCAYQEKSNHDYTLTDAPMYNDGMGKGIAPMLPKKRTNLEFYIPANVESGVHIKLPVRVKNYYANMYDANGVSTEKWTTGVNPVASLYNAAYNGVPSSVVAMKYYDPSKLNYYGYAVPDNEKETTWYFDWNRNKYMLPSYEGYWNGIERTVYLTDSISPYYKPNDVMTSFSALNEQVFNDYSYDIGYGSNVTSYAVVSGMGGYSVELTYNVTFNNLGSPKTISYHMDGQGAYIIDYNGVLRNRKPEPNGSFDETMAEFYVPTGKSTHTFTVVLPTANASGIENYFEIS